MKRYVIYLEYGYHDDYAKTNLAAANTLSQARQAVASLQATLAKILEKGKTAKPRAQCCAAYVKLPAYWNYFRCGLAFYDGHENDDIIFGYEEVRNWKELIK